MATPVSSPNGRSRGMRSFAVYGAFSLGITIWAAHAYAECPRKSWRMAKWLSAHIAVVTVALVATSCKMNFIVLE